MRLERPLAWLLPVLRDASRDERRMALRMFGALFFVMAAYYMVKPLREGWIASSAIAGLSRTEIKAYSSLVQSLLLIGAVRAYARLAARRSQRLLVAQSSLVCAATAVLFWLVQPDFLTAALPGVGIAFYLWVGLFGVFVVAQFWAFSTELYADAEGKRLLPLVALGASAGAAAGSWAHGALTAEGAVGAHAVPLVAALALVAAARCSGATRGQPVRAARRSPGSLDLRRLVGDRFVLAAGVLALLLSWATTNGENLLFQIVQDGVARTAALDPAHALEQSRLATAAFYGDFYFWTNVAAFATQLLLATRLLGRGRFTLVIFALPVLVLLASAAAALAPALAVLKWMKVAEQATDHSLNQTARQVLWLPATTEMKYESKPAVDTIFVRLGDGLAALTMLASSHCAASATHVLIVVNVVLAIAWIAAAFVMVREHGRLVAARAAEARRSLGAATRRTRCGFARGARRALARGMRRAVRFADALVHPPPMSLDAALARLAVLPIGRGQPPPLAALA